MTETTVTRPKTTSLEHFLQLSNLAIELFALLVKEKNEDRENHINFGDVYADLPIVAWDFSKAVNEWQDEIIAVADRTGYSEFRPFGIASHESTPVIAPTGHECLSKSLTQFVKAISRNELGDVDPYSIADLPSWYRERSKEIVEGFRSLRLDTEESIRMISAVVRERSLMKKSIREESRPAPELVTVKMVAEKVGLERKSMTPYEKQWNTKPTDSRGKHCGRKAKLYPLSTLLPELKRQFRHVDFSEWEAEFF